MSTGPASSLIVNRTLGWVEIDKLVAADPGTGVVFVLPVEQVAGVKEEIIRREPR